MQYNIKKLFSSLVKQKYRLSDNTKHPIDVIVTNAETQKGAMTVIATGLIYKYYYPEQDVRYHKASMKKGYSGRSFDTKYVTPFLAHEGFPSMAESGWLTRSLEQHFPYKGIY